MDLMDLLKTTGGSSSVERIAASLNLDPSQAAGIVSALTPALTRGLQKQAESGGDTSRLSQALAGGGHERYVDNPELMQDPAAREEGNKILGHLFGSKDVSRNVAAKASQDTGISAELIKQALPLVAGLAMGALSKQTSARASAPSGNALGGLLGGLLGGSGQADDGIGVDDLLGLAKRFF